MYTVPYTVFSTPCLTQNNRLSTLYYYADSVLAPSETYSFSLNSFFQSQALDLDSAHRPSSTRLTNLRCSAPRPIFLKWPRNLQLVLLLSFPPKKRQLGIFKTTARSMAKPTPPSGESHLCSRSAAAAKACSVDGRCTLNLGCDGYLRSQQRCNSSTELVPVCQSD